MATQYFTTYCVHGEPLIYLIWYGKVPKKLDVTINSTSEHAVGLRGDLQILHLWQGQTDTIIDVRVMYSYAKTYTPFPQLTMC